MSGRARCHEDEETSVRSSRRRKTVPIVKVRERRRPASTVLSARRKDWAYLKPETSRRSDRGAMVPTVWRLPALSRARNHRFLRSTSRELIWCKLTCPRTRWLCPSLFFRSWKTRRSRKPCKKVSYCRTVYFIPQRSAVASFFARCNETRSSNFLSMHENITNNK